MHVSPRTEFLTHTSTHSSSNTIRRGTRRAGTACWHTLPYSMHAPHACKHGMYTACRHPRHPRSHEPLPVMTKRLGTHCIPDVRHSQGVLMNFRVQVRLVESRAVDTIIRRCRSYPVRMCTNKWYS